MLILEHFGVLHSGSPCNRSTGILSDTKIAGLRFTALLLDPVPDPDHTDPIATHWVQLAADETDSFAGSFLVRTSIPPPPPPIPIPSAIWLLGSGLLGIMSVRRKFKK